MSYLEKSEPLWGLLERVVQEEGLELYDVERQSAGLRVVIARRPALDSGTSELQDTAAEAGEVSERGSGVSSGDCSKVCRRLMVQFEAEGPEYGLSTEPQIEVSSPGIDRVLRTEEHFLNAVGERIKVTLDSTAAVKNAAATVKKKKSGPYLGELKSFEDGELTLVEEQGGEEMRFPYECIRKASVAFKF